jgi:membrane fusion protein (multidrug efflux system)
MNPIIQVAGYVSKGIYQRQWLCKKEIHCLQLITMIMNKIDGSYFGSSWGNFEVSKADTGSVLASISVSNANVKAAGNIETAKLD